MKGHPPGKPVMIIITNQKDNNVVEVGEVFTAGDLVLQPGEEIFDLYNGMDRILDVTIQILIDVPPERLAVPGKPFGHPVAWMIPYHPPEDEISDESIVDIMLEIKQLADEI